MNEEIVTLDLDEVRGYMGREPEVGRSFRYTKEKSDVDYTITSIKGKKVRARELNRNSF